MRAAWTNGDISVGQLHSREADSERMEDWLKCQLCISYGMVHFQDILWDFRSNLYLGGQLAISFMMMHAMRRCVCAWENLLCLIASEKGRCEDWKYCDMMIIQTQ